MAYAARTLRLQRNHPVRVASQPDKDELAPDDSDLPLLGHNMSVKTRLGCIMRELKPLVAGMWRRERRRQEWDSPWQPPLTDRISIVVDPGPKEDAAVRHAQFLSRLPNDAVTVYTDGSKEGSRCSLAACVVDTKTGEIKTKVSHRLQDVEVADCESAAIVEALTLLAKTEKITKQARPCYVFVDSQAAIARLRKHGHFAWQARRVLGTFTSPVTVMWCPGHMGIAGNEIADAVARQALESDDERKFSSLGSVFARVRRFTMDKWETLWAFERDTAAGPSHGSHYLRTIGGDPVLRAKAPKVSGPRWLTSAYFQMKVGKGNLLPYLLLIKKTDSDRCRRCQEHESESVEHVLLHCAAFSAERQEMAMALSPKSLDLPTLFNTNNGTEVLLNFLGFANFYRCFVPEYSTVAAPLTLLTKKDQPFKWEDEQLRSFEALKKALVSAPLLATFDPDLPTIVEADASGWALGGSLRQQGADSLWRPVAYFSRKLSPAEVNYPIHDKEMLAIHSCLRAWRSYLAGIPFEVHTDHQNLLYFQKQRTLSERQRRWAHELSEFDFRLIHRPGVTQVTSDALSRRDQDLPQDLSDERLQSRVHQVLRPDGPDFVIAAAVWAKEPDKDPEGTLTLDHAALDAPFADPELQTLWHSALTHNERYWQARQAVQEQARSFPNEWGLPWQISECTLDSATRLLWRDRLWIPYYEPLRTRIIQQVHDSTLTGHPGGSATRDLVSRSYAWPGLSDDVRRFVGNCDTCGKSKIWRDQKRGLLKPLPVPDRAWQELAMDFIVGLPESEGCTTILGITDRLSKSKILIPLKSYTASDVARAFITHVFAHHGLPRAITSDRGPQFTGLFWTEVCRQLSITRRLSTAFHPETDGAQERSNQEIETYLRAFTVFLQDDWAALLPQAQVALNNRTATATGLSPFFFTHGYNIDPLDMTTDHEPGSTVSPATAGHNWLAKHRDATAFAQASMAFALETQERHANRGRQAAEAFKVGDRVYLRLRNVRTIRPSKTLDWLALPYRVIQVVGTHAVKLDTPTGIHPVFHVSLVRRARDDPLPSQVLANPEPPAIAPEEASGDLVAGEYLVDEILQHKVVDKHHEIKEAIMSANAKKAPGPDGMNAKIIQIAFEAHPAPFLSVYKALSRLGIHPTLWKQATGIVLAKDGKADYSVVKSYRIISLLNCLGKVLEKVFATRLGYLANCHDSSLLDDTQLGGRKQRSAMDAALVYVSHLQKVKEMKLVPSTLFLDVKGAFDHVSKPYLMRSLRELGLPLVFRKWVASFLQDRTVGLHIEGQPFPMTPVNIGIPQGSPISPLLFLLYARHIVARVAGDTPQLQLSYIDDFSVTVASKSPRRSAALLEELVTELRAKARDYGIEFEESKTELIHYTDAAKWASQTVRVGDVTVRPQKMVKWLGFHFDNRLSFKQHVQARTQKAEIAFRGLLRLASNTRGLSIAALRQLYISCVGTVADYGSILWYDPSKPQLSLQRVYQKLQSQAAARILGTFRGSPTRAVEVEAGLPPPSIRFAKARMAYAARTLRLQRNHPVRVASQPDKDELAPDDSDLPLLGHNMSVKTRLGCIMRELKPLVAGMWRRERRRQEWDSPWQPPLTDRISIVVDPGPKEDAAVRHAQFLSRLPNDAVTVYTDGSKEGSRCSLAACVVDTKTGEIKTKVSHRLQDVEVADCESAAIVEALTLLAKTEKITKQARPCYVFVDSQAAIARLRKHGHFAWQARRVLATGSVFARVRRFTMDKWETLWAFERDTAAGPSHGSHYLRTIGGDPVLRAKAPKVSGPRWLTSAYFQMKVGKGNLLPYLLLIKKTDSDRCRRCQEHESESVEHVLLHCAAFSAERQEMAMALSPKSLDLPTLFNTNNGTVAVVQWYSTWQGFSVSYREVVGSIPTSDANFLRAVNLDWGTWDAPFADPELQTLWHSALTRNERYWQARQAVQEQARSFPNEWGLPWQISECTLDSATRLLWRDRLWIPYYEPLRTRIIQQVHDSTLTGHPGGSATRDLVSRSYAWPGLSDDVRRFVGNCDTCGKSKIWRDQKRGLLKPLPVPDRAWQELAMDFIVGLPESEGCTTILGITDRLSKSKILIPLKSYTASDVARAFITHVFAHHGLPRAITSDRGPQFTGLFWTEVCRQLSITRRLSTAFHPETDGAQERSNQEIETYLRAFTVFLQDDWAALLPQAQVALNNRTATATGLSPFFFTHGYNIDPLDMTTDHEPGSTVSPATAGHNWLAKCKALRSKGERF
ncbi:uncharacterized protein BROUX77_007569 [Berkeleyomyces rouxiae]|uniref:uncharacterized protein n=1 Tax=Berkeleyomyces rouxiae TaxID=2035830 RepID=UPI003B7F17A8